MAFRWRGDDGLLLVVFGFLSPLNNKLKICPWDMNAPTVAKFAYSHKQKQKDILMNKGQSLWKSQYDMDHFET